MGANYYKVWDNVFCNTKKLVEDHVKAPIWSPDLLDSHLKAAYRDFIYMLVPFELEINRHNHELTESIKSKGFLI